MDIQVIHGNLSEILQRGDLIWCQFPGLPVDDTETTNCEAIPILKRDTRVEADVGFPDNKRIMNKARILH